MRKIIMDVDPGHDDAIAILVANKIETLEILGITVVSGNCSLETTVKNTLNICTKLDLDYKIYQGMDGPMLRDRYLSSDSVGDVHGKTGLDGPSFGEIKRKLEVKHAVQFMVDSLMTATAPITLVASGPLSNLAMALRLEPRIKAAIEEIVLMGGSYGSGNVTASAEFNILADPDAAHVVFSSGLPITMMGLDLTRQTLAWPHRMEKIRALRNLGSEFFCDLVDFFTVAQREAFGWEAPPLHDVSNIIYLAKPEAFRFISCDVHVERTPGLCYGRTVCDVNHLNKKPVKTKVGDQLDADLFWEVMTEAISKY